MAPNKHGLLRPCECLLTGLSQKAVKDGVSDGNRTRGLQGHNLAL